MLRSVLAISAILTLVGPGAADPLTRLGVGRPATPSAIAAWDIDVRADGRGLPPGRGTVREGAAVFAARCAGCHGAQGEGAAADALVGGRGTLATAKPLRTIGSYWPYATTLFDYVRRAMPFDAPQSLTPDEVYAVSAYLLHRNGILPEQAGLDADSLARVVMPNRDGFTTDPRPDLPAPIR
ncbi:cytochrome c [Methylobacterium sp. E-016]|jgi:cytochrome c|uniref:c-type cytochrome n=1 Tax=Methylobacterium sp. E-016 TaxID=2836556 RepID=UPI001FBB064E|nr:cytochrome c [Methylobacterium sp. E-016]MCJ2079657.1 cytochrome c [Methylobacterium sp. E-016]